MLHSLNLVLNHHHCCSDFTSNIHSASCSSRNNCSSWRCKHSFQFNLWRHYLPTHLHYCSIRRYCHLDWFHWHTHYLAQKRCCRNCDLVLQRSQSRKDSDLIGKSNIRDASLFSDNRLNSSCNSSVVYSCFLAGRESCTLHSHQLFCFHFRRSSMPCDLLCNWLRNWRSIRRVFTQLGNSRHLTY